MTPEPLIDKQVRLLLEQECARLFTILRDVPCDCEGRAPERLSTIGFTLIVFDFGTGPLHFVSFKTTLHMKRLCETTTWLLDRWQRGAPTESLTAEQLGDNLLISVDPLLELQAFLVAQLPRERGFALMVGSEPWVRYVANGERSGVATMLKNELLPQWEKLR